MKHSSRYLIYYALLLGLVLSGSIALAYMLNTLFYSVGIILFVLFIPSVIQGFFWHDLFLGRRYLEKGQWKEAAQSFEDFLKKIQKSPWMKHLVWLRWARFTSNVEAMALSNLGVAELNMGNVESADQHFQKASELDPHYPVPYFNLAVISMFQDRKAEAKTFLKKSRELGYSRTDYTQLQHISEALKEKIERKTA